jgi:hypothetical protein
MIALRTPKLISLLPGMRHNRLIPNDSARRAMIWPVLSYWTLLNMDILCYICELAKLINSRFRSMQSIMSFGSARKASVLIAAFGAGALAFAGPAGAQAVADNAALSAATDGSPACVRYKNDPASHAQCEFNESVRRTKEYERAATAARQQAAASREQAAAADKRTACNLSLQDEIKGKPDRIQAVRVILGGKSIREVDPCSVLEQLKKG